MPESNSIFAELLRQAQDGEAGALEALLRVLAHNLELRKRAPSVEGCRVAAKLIRSALLSVELGDEHAKEARRVLGVQAQGQTQRVRDENIRFEVLALVDEGVPIDEARKRVASRYVSARGRQMAATTVKRVVANLDRKDALELDQIAVHMNHSKPA